MLERSTHRTLAVEVSRSERNEFLISFHLEKIMETRLLAYIATFMVLVIMVVCFTNGLMPMAFLFGTFLIAIVQYERMEINRLKKVFLTLGKTFDPALVAKQTVALSDEGISVECYGGATQFIPWIGVSGLHSGKFVLAFQTGVYQGVVVPLRAFPDEQSKVAFIEFANKQLSIARKA